LKGRGVKNNWGATDITDTIGLLDKEYHYITRKHKKLILDKKR